MTTPSFPGTPQPSRPGVNPLNPAPPAGYQPPGAPSNSAPGAPAPGQPPSAPDQPPSKRGNALTSRPVIGVAALVVGLALGTGVGSAGNADPIAAAPAPAPTVTVTTTTTATPQAPTPVESSEPEPEPAPTEEATPEPAPVDVTQTSFKWGKKASFTYEDVEITLKIEKPKASTNTFDKDNLEAKVTVCNKGDQAIQELSAQGMGLYAEDKAGGQYSLYGPYRSPEFPVYSWDSAKLKAGKCRTGWVSFEDGRSAVRIALDIDDETYSWSKSGK